jgi:hypothetical protein
MSPATTLPCLIPTPQEPDYIDKELDSAAHSNADYYKISEIDDRSI